ncbi:hypothetical protein L6164_005554 [Bauhinia variegata]|uniref:Uncharacterized protein n=1 Tax=Bauhinia variegata TaxID=167791 RepID=A0ACB9PT39_BAUVA|nr:hypothetical protein L6164_005554 [Bauhinia variegata]
MATESKPASNPGAAAKDKKRKRYLPHNKPVKKKGSYPLHPGIQGFFITCDGGREQQASREALNVIDSFYDELVLEEDSSVKVTSNKPLNTKITFSDSDSSSSDDNDESEEDDEEVEQQEAEEEKGDKKLKSDNSNDGNGASGESDPGKIKDLHVQAVGEVDDNKGDSDNCESQGKTTDEPLVEKQHCKINVPTCDSKDKEEPKSIDRLIEEELKELGDKNKRRFVKLDSGCNGLVFIQMRKKGGEIGPKDIVQHMVTSLASTRKHMSRFILRILPIEVSCYASEEEISKAVKPLVERYFPVETQNPEKFAVLYEARANSGIDRMKIIDAIAKSVPGPHKVDLNHPDKTIVVEIVKTVCLIGVVEKYKELAKYNIRQLTSPKA